MCMIEKAGELARKKTYRDSLKRMQANAAETRQTLGEIGADEKLIRAADRRLMEINNEITRLNDEIFSLEKELGITREGDNRVKIPGAD